jgi:predicted membrane protein DUF2207
VPLTSRLLAGAGVAAALLVASAGAASAASEQIDDYQVDLMLQQNASMHVKETIVYDFASAPDKHGIIREIPVEFEAGDGKLREYPISDISVTQDGRKTSPKIEPGARTAIRIGDPHQPVSGKHRYVIEYDLRGVVNTFSDHQELYWNAIGDEWSVPIRRASATVEGPAAIQKVACFRGSQGTTETCDGSIGGSGSASFSTTGLSSSQGMTVVTSFPAGTFPNAAPILKEKQTLSRAFSAGPVYSLPAAAILAALVGGMAYLVTRRGRDEHYLSVIPGLEPGLGQDAAVSRRPLFGGRPPVAVQFQPPDGMRPGQLGTLIDEQANTVDVTATIVDLAVRGWLTVEEVEQPGFMRKGDWRLSEVTPAPSEQLQDYETKLFNSLFQGRSSVLLSELKQTFRSDLQSVQSLLYADVTSAGWFRGNPSSVRIRWVVYGALLTALGIGLTIFLAVNTRFGLVGAAVALGGLVVLALSGRMPARTAKGTALLAQAEGFKLYLTKAEASQIRFEEGQDIFSRYLPYAIVFGVAERWAGIFDELAKQGVQFDAPTWYVGPYLYGTAFNYAAFGSSMDSFSTTTSGSIAEATPSSSGSSGFGGGGFAGGGGGGGGGGSW